MTGEEADWYESKVREQDAHIAELTAEVAAGDLAVAQADRTIARLIAELNDTYVPTDDEVIAWMRRSEIDESHIEHWRMAINDARSMHLIARNALREG